MVKIDHQRTLVLNSDYRPFKDISWKKAVCLDIKGQEDPGRGVRVLKYYEDDYIYTSGGDIFPVPAVVITNAYIKPKKMEPRLSKANILIRDNYSCQYCKCKLSPANATLDHIIPKKSGKVLNTWENLVLACYPCNSKKAAKTLEEAGMKLLSTPKPLTRQKLIQHRFSSTPHEWQEFLL